MRIRATFLSFALLAMTAGALAQSSQPSDRIADLEKRLEAAERKLGMKIDPDRDHEEDTIPPHELDTHDHDHAKDHGKGPQIAVFGNFIGNVSSLNENPARNRADVGLVALEFRGQIEKRADAFVALGVFREVHDELFFNPADAEGEVEQGVELEEAYLNLHDFGVPNFSARVGRFHLFFGQQNLLHSHQWLTPDNSFVNQNFLGHEALSDAGVSLRYSLPERLVKDRDVELIAELVSGEGGGEEGPVINNDAFADGPALNLHARWVEKISKTRQLELGSSFLIGRHTEGDQTHRARLLGFDATYRFNDPRGQYDRLAQLECIYGDIGLSDGDRSHAFGVSLLLQQQLAHHWYVGVRCDWTENALDATQEVWGVSPYVTWYWNEALRFRLQYQHRGGDVPSDNTLYAQVTWMLGTHGAH